MEDCNSTERTVPVQFIRGTRAFKQFKNPPQPHMCIQDTIKNSKEKLYINVLGWQKIANPKQYTDPIPLYGGMQVPQGCGPNSTKPPLIVFAVMVNPEILKVNGKNAANPMERDALVTLLCDFVEAMNPGLRLVRNPVIMKDRDLAGELKDVWLAVQTKREREKGTSQEVSYKIYDIDTPQGSQHFQTSSYSENHMYGDDKDIMDQLNMDHTNYNKSSQINTSKSLCGNELQNPQLDSKAGNGATGQRNEISSSSSRDGPEINVNYNGECLSRHEDYLVSSMESQHHIASDTINSSVHCSSISENHLVQGDLPNSSINSNNVKMKKRKQEKYSRSNKDHPWTMDEAADFFAKRYESNLNPQKNSRKTQRIIINNGTLSDTSLTNLYNFFPTFATNATVHDTKVPKIEPIIEPNKPVSELNHSTITGESKYNFTSMETEERSENILDTMQKLALRSTDNKHCDSSQGVLRSTVSS